MSITNLTGTTWVLKNNLDYYQNSASDYNININFTSNNTNYTKFGLVLDDGISEINLYYDRIWVCTMDTSTPSIYWENEAYRTITITGGTDATSSTFITWLKQNAIISVDVASLTNYASISAGLHTISAVATSSDYRNSLPTDLITFNKLSTATNESVNEDTYTFNSVADADNYDIYVDDGAGHVYLLGTLSPFDYEVENNTVTVDDAVYTADNGVVTIE